MSADNDMMAAMVDLAEIHAGSTSGRSGTVARRSVFLFVESIQALGGAKGLPHRKNRP